MNISVKFFLQYPYQTAPMTQCPIPCQLLQLHYTALSYTRILFMSILAIYPTLMLNNILQSPQGSWFPVNPLLSIDNGKARKFDAKIDMGPTQPPQRKGRLPPYSTEKLQILQDRCNELEALRVLRKPEEINITVEYLNPSFLVSKPNGWHRLVAAFEDCRRYSKPQPFLMPDIDSTLATIS